MQLEHTNASMFSIFVNLHTNASMLSYTHRLGKQPNTIKEDILPKIIHRYCFYEDKQNMRIEQTHGVQISQN